MTEPKKDLNKELTRDPKLYLETVKNMLNKQQRIPSLPPLVGELQGNIKSFNFAQVDNVIKQDPTLTASILKVSNSALFKRPVPVASLKDAIATLGLGTVQSLVVAHQLKGLFQTRDNTLNEFLTKRWESTQRLAACSKKMANLLNMDGDLAYLCAILSDLGSSLIAQEFSQFQNVDDQPSFNWVANHYAHLISAHLLQFWKFEELLWLPIKKKGQWDYRSPDGLAMAEIINMCWVHTLNSENTPELEKMPRFQEIPPTVRLLASERQFFLLKEY